jgi:2-oxoisovalerate dehydrogenase E2 component (dihydrolipoyl transacylase)
MAMAQLVMPNVGEGVTEGTVTRWLKREGERVAQDEPVVEIETDKAVAEIPSPFAGTLARVLVAEGETVPIGTPLADFEATDEPAGTAARAEVQPAAKRAAATASGTRPGGAVAGSDGHDDRWQFRRRRRYSPVVLKLAAEHDIDLELVQGTGIEGRVTRQDVLRYLENPSLHTVAPPEGAGVVGASTQERAREQEGGADGERIALSPTRRTIAQRMLEAHRTIPAAWMVVEADVTGLVAVRERLKDRFRAQEGIALTYLPFFVQAVAAAVREVPELNATWSDDGIVRHRRCDAGIAVATERGLVVPVLRDAGGRSLAGIAREIDALASRARERKLTVEEMHGATITVDNTGAFGSMLSQPIVPVGQVAIVTLEAVRRELRPTDDGGFAPRSVVNLCLSFDHRAVDGAEAGRFMHALRERLEALATEPILD